MVDISSFQLTAGSTYGARVIEVFNRIPAGGRASYFYCLIGWTWVKDHAD
jgi:hypothetical protein